MAEKSEKPEKKTAAKKPASKATTATTAAKSTAAKSTVTKAAAKSTEATTATTATAKPAAKKAAAKPARKAGKKAAAQKFRVRLCGFDYRLLDLSTENIVNTAKRAGAVIHGPVPLPVRRRRYDILRSPHKYKKSREQIEIREYFRLLDIVDVSNKATSALASLELPPGVHADIKVLQS